MGTFQNVVSSLCFLCVLFVIFTYGNDIETDKTSRTGLRNNDYDLKTGRRADGSIGTDCPCSDSCTIGAYCNESLEQHMPKFSVRTTRVKITSRHVNHGIPLQYNSTTYPHGRLCPCELFEYSIENIEGEEDVKEMFSIDSQTGDIRLKSGFEYNDIYHLEVVVTNVKNGGMDSTRLTIVPDDDRMYGFEESHNGYLKPEPELHKRYKRAVVPAEVEFDLQLTNESPDPTINAGKRIIHTLTITFPARSIDMSVELFAPDSTTNVMILCDVQITTVSPELSITPGIAIGNGNVVFGAKPGYDNETYADWAVIDLGTIDNSAGTTAETSIITIQYEAVMIENSLTTDGGSYWISAGALYDNEDFIWIGQSSVNVDTSLAATFSDDPVFNVTMPTNIALGATHLIGLELYIPYPVRDYVVKVFPPADTVGVMSVCGIWLLGTGSHFACGNDYSNVNSSLLKNPQGIGNAIGQLDLGRMLNKAGYDTNPAVSENLVSIEAIVHLYADTGLTYQGQTLELGIALEIDTQTVWIGGASFTVDPEVTTGLTDVTVNTVPSSSLNVNLDDAITLRTFEMNYTITVPSPTIADVASDYTVEMLMPMDGSIPEFSVCELSIISVGRGLSCVLLDDLYTEYSSRSGGAYSEPDRAIINLGHVINMGIYTDPGDNDIVVAATIMPLKHSNNVNIGSKHNITFGVMTGAQSVTLAISEITIGNEGSSVTVTNVTQPTFSLSATNVNVPVGGSTKVVIEMTTNPGETYDQIETEFLMPKLTDTYAYYHVCKVQIESVGSNLPCMSPDWYNEQVSYISTFEDYLIDRVTLSTGTVCNVQNVIDPQDDKASYAVYVQVLDRPELQTGVSEDVSFGLVYSNSDMWIGTIQVNPQRNQIISPVGNSYIFSQKYSGVDPLPLGMTHVYRMMIKIPTGQSADLAVVVASSDVTKLQVCSVRVVSAGDNLPCVADEVSSRIYQDDMSSVELRLGVVTNYGDGSVPMVANSYEDDNTIIVEYIVRAHPLGTAGSPGFTTTTYLDTNRNNPISSSFSATVTTDTSTISEVYPNPNPVSVSIGIGEITGADNTTDITYGESKRILVAVEIPENSLYRVRVRVTVPTAYVGILELCQASLVSVGDNLPCIQANMDGDLYSTTSGVYNDEADFNLGYVCSVPLRSGDAVANTATFEVFARLVPKNIPNIGDLVTVQASVTVFNTSVDVVDLDFTVTDPALFTDRRLAQTGVSNTTLVSIDHTGTIQMGVADNITVTANLSIPRNSVSRLLFDVEMPVTDSACMTVGGVRVLGSVGVNVLCVEGEANSKGVVYSPLFESAYNNSQMNYAYVDLGIVTNTGYSYARDTFQVGDDDVQVEFDMQMADCSGSASGTLFALSIGKKISDYVVIYDHDVQITRTGNELPDFQHDLVVDNVLSTSTVIFLNGTLVHNVSSTAEGVNTSVLIFLPFYQKAPTTFYSNKDDCNLIVDGLKPNYVEILCDRFFFTDEFQYGLEIELDTSVSLPPGFSSDPSYAFSMVGTYYQDWSGTYNTTDWYPYFLDETDTISYPLTVPTTTSGCGSTIGVENTATVWDCQFSSSGNMPGSTAAGARYGASSVWVSFIRDNEWAKRRWIQVYFGHLHTYTSILIKNVVGYRDEVTEVEVSYTNDGETVFQAEVVSLGTDPNIEETLTLSGIEARGVRLRILNDTSNLVKPQVGLQFKLFGCKTTVDPAGLTNQEACDAVDNQPTHADFHTRSFIGLSATAAYYCDRDITKNQPRGKCYCTSDAGTTWKRVDGRVGSLIGYSDVTQLFAINNDGHTLMMIDSVDEKVATVTQTKLNDAKLEATWLDAIAIPETDDVDLTQVVPTVNYIMNGASANYGGIFFSGTQNLDWT